MRGRSGKSSATWWAAWRHCMIRTYCTGIWNAQTYSWTKTAQSKWETWMYRRSQSMEGCSLHRQERLTMQVLRSGKINLMITRVTSGLSGVWSMRWLAYTHHSRQLIWISFTRRFLAGNTQVSLLTSQTSLLSSFLRCSKSSLRKDLHAITSSNTTSCRQSYLLKHQTSEI